jgi:hypothetical protein
VVDDVVESVKSIVCEICSINFSDLSSAYNDDLSLNARESLGDNSDGCRLLGFVYDGCKRFVMLVHASIEAFSPSKIFGWVSPDV